MGILDPKPLTVTAANATFLTVLVHNGTAYPARPTGAPAGMVRYVGPSSPTGALSGDEWLDTSAADTTAPSAVTGLTAGTATTTTVPLSWTAATDDVAVAGYEYSTNGTTYTSTGSTGTTYTVTGLTAGTAYTIYVRAFDAAGNRGTAASVTKTTAAAADTTAPTAVTGLAAGTTTASTIPLTWTAATDNVAVTGYEYTTNGTTWVSTGSTATSYTVTGLSASTAYTVQVRAFDAAGNKGTAASVTATTAASADTTAPTAPTNLAGTAGATTMDLSWTASTDAVGVTGYRVSKDNGATWITSSVTGTTYQVTGLTAGTSYTFAVAARDAAGNWSTNATLVKSTNAAQTYKQAVAALSPTYFLPLDDAAGTTVPAQTGSGGLAPSLDGTPTFGAPGIGGGTSSMYATTGGVKFPTTAIIDGAAAMSFVAVVKVESLAAASGVFGKNIGAKMSFATNGRVTTSVNDATAINNNTTHTLAAGTVYTIGITYDGTNLKYFRNGVLAQTVAGSGAIKTSASETLRIGGITSSSNAWLQGWMYGAGIWAGTALTDAQMLELAQAAGTA